MPHVRHFVPALVALATLAVAGLAGATVFTGGSIAIPDQGSGSPYPSEIVVSDPGLVADVNVTISGFSHTCPEDVAFLLLSPSGVKVLLQDRAGICTANNLTWTFDDEAASPLPCDSIVVSGTFRPGADCASSDFGNPPRPYATSLFAIDGSAVNGAWRLYVHDFLPGDAGTIAGWSVDVTSNCTRTGTPGNDNLVGTDGADVLCAGDGNDSLTGLGGNDQLLGGNGKDVLLGGRGNDLLDGGAGADTGGWYDSGVAGGMTVDLTAPSATNTTLGTDTFAQDGGANSLENVEGTPFGDTIQGDARRNALSGRGGDDTVQGGDGVDLIRGGDGEDLVTGQGGDDRVQPGTGDDVFGQDPGINTLDYSDLAGSGAGVTVSLSNGTVTGFAGTEQWSPTISAFRHFYGSARNDAIDARLFHFASTVNGFAGDDSIDTEDGGAAADFINGGDGTNTCTVDGIDGTANCL